MKRTPIRRVSPKARKVAAAHREIREAVFARDGHRCVLAEHPEVPRCFGHLTVHHLRKAGQGGAYVLANLATLCVFHNVFVEDHPTLAHRLGLVKRAGE